MTIKHLHLLALFAFVLGAVSVVLTFWALDAQRTEALVINLAGRQRMLVQQMRLEAQSTGLAANPADRQRLHGAANTYFEQTLNALINGGEAPYTDGTTVNLPATRNPEILAKLRSVRATWDAMHPALHEALQEDPRGAAYPEAAAGVEHVAPTLLSQADEVVRLYEAGVARRVTQVQIVQAGLLAAVAALLMTILVVSERQVLGPLARLEAAARRIAGRDLTTPVPITGVGEVVQLARSFDEMRRSLDISVKAQAALLKLSQTLLVETEAQAIIESAAQVALRTLNVEFAAIALVDADGQSYSGRAAVGWPPDVIRRAQRVPLAANNGLGYAIRTQASVVIPDESREVRFGAPPWIAQMGITSSVIVPMLVAGKAVGGLIVNSRVVRNWSGDEVRRLSLIANNTAQALERIRHHAALQAAEARYRGLFDGVPVGLYRTTPDGQFIDANPALAQMLGYPDRESLLAANAINLYVNLDDRQQWQALAEHNGVLHSFEEQVRRRDGTIIWLEDSARAIRDAEGRVLHYEGALVDITGRKLADEERAHLLKWARSRAQRLEALYETARVTTDVRDLQQLLDQALDRIVNRLPADAARVYLREEEAGNGLRLTAQRGFSSESAAFFARQQVGDLTIAGQVADRGQPLLIEDMTAFRCSPEARQVMQSEGVASHAAVPLRADTAVVGVLHVAWRQHQRLDTEGLALLEGLADILVSGLLNARRVQETRRHADEVAAASDILRALNAAPDVGEAFPAMVAGLRAITGCERVSVILFDESQTNYTVTVLDQPRAELAWGIQAPLTATNITADILAGRPHLTPDLAAEADLPTEQELYQAGHRSRINLPLRVGEQVIGALNLTWLRPSGYTVAQLPLLSQLAAALALAVEKSRLLAETTEALAREQRLNEVARAISSALDLPTILQTVVRLAAELVGAEAGVFGLVAQDGATMADLHSFNLPEALTRQAIPKGKGVVWRIAETGELILLSDYSAHPDALPEWVAAGVHAFIGVPVLAGDTRLGALGLFALNPEKRFAERDLALAASVSQQAGVAIQNARLFEAERRRVAVLTALHQTGLDLSAQLDLPTLLRTIVERAARLLDASMGGLYLLQPDGQTLELVVSHNLGRDYTGTHLRLGEGLCGVVAQTGEPLVVGDYSTWPGRASLYEGAPFRAEVGVPIKWQKWVIGAIDVDDERPDRFGPADVEIVRLFADQAAVAIVNARLFEAERRRLRELSVLHAVAAAGAEAASEDALIERATQLVGEAFYPDNFGVMLLDETASALRTHPSYRVRQDVKRMTFPLGRGITGRVAATGRPWLVVDVTQEPEYVGADPQTRSELCVPLRVGERIIGVVNAESAKPAAFHEADERLLATFAGQLATAIEKARLFGALRESEARFRRLADNAQDIIYRYRLHPSPGFEYISPAVTAITGYSPKELCADPDLGIRLAYPDDQPHRAAMARGDIFPSAPFALRWTHKDGTVVWTEQRNVPIYDEADNLVAVEGIARDITERKRRERELETMATMSAALRTAQTRAEMLPVILDQLLDLLKVDGAMLSMRDPNSGETVIELARGNLDRATGLRLPPGQGINGYVIATSRPYVTADIRTDPRMARSGLPGDLRAVACVPLIAQGQTIGALCVGRASAGGSEAHSQITDDELRLLIAAGDMAASAIHRATLHEQTERRLQRLTALHAIDVVISASPDLHMTLNILLEQVTTQLGVHAADVLLLNPHRQILEYAAGRGFRTSAIAHSRLHLGEGHAGRAALERRTIHIADLPESGTAFVRAGLLAGENLIAYCATPLIVKGQVKGVLEIFHRTPLNPDQEWLDFLETLAGQAAIAIDNAELFEGLQRSNVELALAYDATIEGWSRALDLRDRETEGHTQRVTETTLRLARAMGMSEAELVHVRRGALLHDIGKMGIPDTILSKPGPLTDEEQAIMRLHPGYAYEMLAPIAYLRPALDIPHYHHEKWDGTGYSRGLKGEQIPLVARIFAVVDVWDALRSDRPYRKGWPEETVREYIHEQAGVHFDPQVVEAFLKMDVLDR